MTLSILVPVYRPDPTHLAEAIRSVLEQTDPDWQLVLAPDGPQPPEVDEVLDRQTDPRIVIEGCPRQGGISEATNAALGRATGSFVTFLDNDDLLAPRAVAAVAEALALSDEIDVVYSDEDKLDLAGSRTDPFHKPGWSPERLMGQMYLGHLCAYRRSIVEEVGGLRTEFNGAQDHDLALRVTSKARRIAHLPEVLYHWRQSTTSTALDPAAKTWAFDAGTRAVADHLQRQGIEAVAIADRRFPGVTAVNPPVGVGPKVSIVMLTGGTSRLVRAEPRLLVENAVSSIVDRSTYRNYEIVVVLDRASTDELAETVLAAGKGRVRIVRDTEPFNFARANNLGVDSSTGSHVIFLNDDTEVVTRDWIERLVFWSSLPGVGVVGCCLEYPDGRLQHAGIVTRPDGPSHRWAGFPADHPGAFSSLALTVNMIGATGACIATRREHFEAVGGFNVEFPLNFNDVDLCFKFISRGFRNVVDNRTRLLHFETSSRPNCVEADEVHRLYERWSELIANDPWDNPNLRGFGVEETPAPCALTQLREVTGAVSACAEWQPRIWPPLHLPVVGPR